MTKVKNDVPLTSANSKLQQLFPGLKAADVKYLGSLLF
jgi:hypothetical protein